MHSERPLRLRPLPNHFHRLANWHDPGIDLQAEDSDIYFEDRLILPGVAQVHQQPATQDWS